MRGSEIDIVQKAAKGVVRSYRTRNTKNASPDRIVHGLRCEEIREKKRGSPMYLRECVVRS